MALKTVVKKFYSNHAYIGLLQRQYNLTQVDRTFLRLHCEEYTFILKKERNCLHFERKTSRY